MEMFADLWMGLSVAISPMNLVYLLIGAMVGMIVGIIPGFGPSAGLAILLPVTFGMDPIGAVMMLAAIYYGAMYGGTITSILLNTPGESATVASTFDGYPAGAAGSRGSGAGDAGGRLLRRRHGRRHHDHAAGAALQPDRAQLRPAGIFPAGDHGAADARGDGRRQLALWHHLGADRLRARHRGRRSRRPDRGASPSARPS